MSTDQPQGPRRATIIAGAVGLSGGFVLGVLVAAPGTRTAAPPAVVAAAPAMVPVPRPQPTVPAAADPGADQSDEPAAPPFPRLREDLAAAQQIAAMTPEAQRQALCAVEGQANREIRYALLERNVDRFLSSVYVATGRAIQVQDIPGERGSFVLVSMDSWGNQLVAVFTYERPDDNIVADRRVRFYGRVVGTYTYQTRNGQTRTVPRVHAMAVVRSDAAPECRR